MGKFYLEVTDDLILYAQQTAWLDATPKTSEKIENKSEQKTRRELIEANNGEPHYPDVGEAFYLTEYWRELGMVMAGGMGPVTLTAQEIESWQRCTMTPLKPWEFRAIKAMSSAYISQLHQSTEPEAPAPHSTYADMVDRKTVGKKVSGLFANYIKSQEDDG